MQGVSTHTHTPTPYTILLVSHPTLRPTPWTCTPTLYTILLVPLCTLHPAPALPNWGVKYLHRLNHANADWVGNSVVNSK